MEDLAAILSSGTNIIILHSNADADAVGSGLALALYFDNSTLLAPAGISRVGKKLLKEIPMEVLEDADLDGYDNIVVVDSCTDTMLGIQNFDWSRAIVIDHHSGASGRAFRHSLIDEKTVSTCELAWSLLKSDKIDENIGLALLTGIIGDSGNFHHAKANTLSTTSEVMEASGVDLAKAFSMFHMDDMDEVSQRISRLKGGQRLKYLREDTWLVAMTQVSTFESTVARGLINLGADVSFVASQKKNNYRITARANPKALGAGLHLGNLLRDVGEEIGAESGGHDGAAGLTGMGESEAILNICAEKALAFLVKANSK